MKILVLIPCYNEEENLERVVTRLKEACPEVDYLVINDKVSNAVGEIEAIMTAAECRVDNRSQILSQFA